MSKLRKAKQHIRPTPALKVGRRRPVALVIISVVVLAVAGAWWWYAGQRDSAASQAIAEMATIESAVPSPTGLDRREASIQQLIGRWMRADGGYIVEIRKVDPNGKLDASYFNPQPINVAKAEASQDGEIIKIFIELRDDNYPGSTYTLFTSSDMNHLHGKYFQAVSGETYDIEFVRQ